MKEVIETSKGLWGVVDNPILPQALSITSKYIKLSEITEEEASSIVDYPIILEEIQGGGEMYTYYNYKTGRYDYGSSLVDSLESLLESQEIGITQNTYIFKV